MTRVGYGYCSFMHISIHLLYLVIYSMYIQHSSFLESFDISGVFHFDFFQWLVDECFMGMEVLSMLALEISCTLSLLLLFDISNDFDCCSWK